MSWCDCQHGGGAALLYADPVDELRRELALVTGQRDMAYRERAELVGHLAAIFPSAIGQTDPDNPEWPVVAIHTPEGVMCWHVAISDLEAFLHVTPSSQSWSDGHTPEEKYRRLRRLTLNTARRGRSGLPSFDQAELAGQDLVDGPVHPLAARFLDQARAFLGYRQDRDEEATPFGTWYAQHLGVEPELWRAAPWSQTFVSMCGWQVGAAGEVGIFGSAQVAAAWFQERGRFDRTALPGTLAYFDWEGADPSRANGTVSHVAIIEALRLDIGIGYIQTLEGDTEADGRQGVRRRVRHLANVVGIAHPEWDALAVAPSPALAASPPDVERLAA